MSFTFLTAAWRKLIMAQYEVAPATLTPWLPPGLELDLYQDRCYVSLVGFLFDRVRILGMPVPLHTRFEEVNLRFYVRRPMPDGTSRRGVIFLSEMVPRPAITLVARALYGEAYSTAPMSHVWRLLRSDAAQKETQDKQDTLEVSYEWKHRRTWQSMAVRASPRREAMAAGSLDEFITEHYWGYTPRRRHGQIAGTSEYAVEHARWQLYPVRAHRISADFGALYGPAFARLSQQAPDHVLLAEGAPVSIRWSGSIA